MFCVSLCCVPLSLCPTPDDATRPFSTSPSAPSRAKTVTSSAEAESESEAEPSPLTPFPVQNFYFTFFIFSVGQPSAQSPAPSLPTCLPCLPFRRCLSPAWPNPPPGFLPSSLVSRSPGSLLRSMLLPGSTPHATPRRRFLEPPCHPIPPMPPMPPRHHAKFRYPGSNVAQIPGTSILKTVDLQPLWFASDSLCISSA